IVQFGDITIGLPGIAPRPVDGESTARGELPRHVHLIVCAWSVLDDDVKFLWRLLSRRVLPFVPLCQGRRRHQRAQACAEHDPVEVSSLHVMLLETMTPRLSRVERSGWLLVSIATALCHPLSKGLSATTSSDPEHEVDKAIGSAI